MLEGTLVLCTEVLVVAVEYHGSDADARLANFLVGAHELILAGGPVFGRCDLANSVHTLVGAALVRALSDRFTVDIFDASDDDVRGDFVRGQVLSEVLLNVDINDRIGS